MKRKNGESFSFELTLTTSILTQNISIKYFRQIFTVIDQVKVCESFKLFRTYLCAMLRFFA